MRAKSGFLAIAAVAALTLAGCANNQASEPGGTTTEGASEIAVDEDAAALLPAEIADAGKLVIGADPTYAPNEFKNDAGRPDRLGDRADQRHGREARSHRRVSARPTSTRSSRASPAAAYDLGMSSFTDNVEREKQSSTSSTTTRPASSGRSRSARTSTPRTPAA